MRIVAAVARIPSVAQVAFAGGLTAGLVLARSDIALIAAIPAAAMVIYLSQAHAKRAASACEEEYRAQTEATEAVLVALRAILDDLDYGIVALDRDRRVHFANCAFRRIWHLPDEIDASGETFDTLMFRGPKRSPYAIAPEKLSECIAAQLQLIRTGEERPIDIRLANGEVFQLHCKVLPNGGRLLSYEDVTNLVHRAERLEVLAAIDGMTGLNNRRNFLVLAKNEWSRFLRYRRPLTMLMIDIDLFKSVNDRYGHDVGDEVIKLVASVLERNKRRSDIVGRIGGEEFAVLLPEADLNNAGTVAERFPEQDR